MSPLHLFVLGTLAVGALLKTLTDKDTKETKKPKKDKKKKSAQKAPKGEKVTIKPKADTSDEGGEEGSGSSEEE